MISSNDTLADTQILDTPKKKRKSIFETIEDLIAKDDDEMEASSSTQVKLQCPICYKSYLTFYGLRRHLNSHEEGNLNLNCQYCHKSYNSLGALKMHLKTHSLPCVCDICGKSFSRPWLLKGHRRTHTGEKPFVCSVCDRHFADRSNLRAHQQTHATEKKHKCSYCDLSFARLHVKTKHETNCSWNVKKSNTNDMDDDL